MSGTSALAAAKRRRAAPTDTPRPSNQSNPRTSPVQSPSAVQPPVQLPAQNPLHLLIQHEQKLNDLEKNMAQLKVSDKTDTLTPDNLQYFKRQYELMSQEVQELKKILIKVQTFSMETNLDVLNLKKSLKIIEPNEPVENIV